MAEDQEERTEEATQTRRDEFRKQGQVANTKELGTALMIIATSFGILALSRFFFSEFAELFELTFGAKLVEAVREGDFFSILRTAGIKFLLLAGPVCGVLMLIGVLSTVVQIGYLQVEDALMPKLERLDPLAGIGRIFSLKNFGEGIKSILKLTVMIIITYFLLKSEFAKVPNLASYQLEKSVTFLGTVLFKLLFGIGLGVVTIALFDYFFQRWELERRMRMTKEEVKQENKNQQGDPLIKARIRRIQRQVANRRMMKDVPKADVIVTNPTHIAVALKYDANLPAPQLIAKGADLVAEKIKEIAKANSIPIVENKPLARTIFKTMKLGQVIPRELYVAVAEVLSFVYKLRRKKRSTLDQNLNL